MSLVGRYFREFLDYRRRGESIYSVERLAQLLIQSLLDLGAMIAVYLGFPKPETYKGVASFISDRLSLNGFKRRLLEQLAGFRSLLVHGYAEVDPKLEEEAFKEMERGLPEILKPLKHYVEGLDVDPSELNVGRGLREVFERHGVRFTLLFGSRVRGIEGGDYDIAVSGDFKSALDLGGLLVDVAEALGICEDRVDIVHLETAGHGILYTILLEGVLIYGDSDEAWRFLYRRYLEMLDMDITFKTAEQAKRLKASNRAN